MLHLNYFMTFSWLPYVLFMTCSWQFQDLFTHLYIWNSSWFFHKLFMTSSQVVHNLFMTFSQLFTIFSQLLMDCSYLFTTFFTWSWLDSLLTFVWFVSVIDDLFTTFQKLFKSRLTCSWLAHAHAFSTTCLWLVHIVYDLFIMCSCLLHDLFMDWLWTSSYVYTFEICLWLVHKLVMTCS